MVHADYGRRGDYAQRGEQLARAQVKQGNYAEALTTTDELLAIAARNGSGGSKDAHYAKFQRALALYGLGRNREALDLAGFDPK